MALNSEDICLLSKLEKGSKCRKYRKFNNVVNVENVENVVNVLSGHVPNIHEANGHAANCQPS